MSALGKKEQRKLAIIGLDGVPYDLLRTLIRDGVMPALEDIVQEGILRKMRSSIPAVSSVAWSSVITGTNPGQHGIFGFTDLAAGSYRLCFPNYAHLKIRPFWEQDQSRRAIIINVPSTYPVRPMNGVHIAGFVAPSLDKTVYPPEWRDRLAAMEYEVDVDSSTAHQSTDLFLRKLDQSLEKRMQVAISLIEEPWDTFMLVFTGTDRLLHFLWAALQDEAHPFHDRVVSYFGKVDRSIEMLVERLGDDVPLVMLSDHGFEHLQCQVNINYVLRREGFLSFRQNPPRSMNDIAEDTVAFALDPGRVYLHLRDRFPRGRVRPHERERILQELETALRELRVEGRPAVKDVVCGQEIYHGPQASRGPDLVAVPNEGIEFKAGVKAEAEVEEPGPFTGKHREDNAFLFVRAADKFAALPEKSTVEGVKAILDALVGPPR